MKRKKLQLRQMLLQHLMWTSRLAIWTSFRRSILLLHWILLKHFFTLLLAISSGLLLLSIYFVSIYGVPNGTNNNLFNTQSIPFQPLESTSKGSILNDLEYHQSDNQIEQNQGWWQQWFRQTGNIFNEQQIQLSNNNTLSTTVNSILTQNVQHTLAVNAQRRSQLIKKHFDSLLNKIKNLADQNQTREKCDPKRPKRPMIHFERGLIAALVTNITSTLLLNNKIDLNVDCDIIVIDGQINYNEFLSSLNNQTKSTLAGRLYRNHFDELMPVLRMPELLCNLFDQVRRYPALRQQPLSPLCFPLPHSLQQFLDVSDALGYSTNWTLEFGIGSGPANKNMIRVNEPLTVFSQTDRSRLIKINRLALRQQTTSSSSSSSQLYASIRSAIFGPILIKQHFIQQVIHFNGRPIRLRIFVLITSLNSLRAYQYNHGLLYVYTQNKSQQDDTPIGTTESFWKSLRNRFTGTEVQQAEKAVHQVLLYTLLSLEISPRLLNLQIKRSLNPTLQDNIPSFQWLAFDLIIQHTEFFQAFIVDILTTEQLLSQPVSDELEILRKLETDTHHLLVGGSMNYPICEECFQHIQQRLEPFLIEKDNIGLLGINCHISHRICLSQTDLIYMIDTLNQFKQMKQLNRDQVKFKSIYPFEWNGIYDLELSNIRALFEQILVHMDVNLNVMNSMNLTGSGESKTNFDYHSFEYQTERLHPIMEIVFAKTSPSSLIDDQTLKTEQNNDIHHELTNSNWIEDDDDGTGIDHNHQTRLQGKKLSICSQDPYSLSYLQKLQILHPTEIELKPKFSPYQTHYVGNDSVDYDQMLIKIQVQVSHCDTWIQLDNHFYNNIQSGQLNYSLGLGDNYIRLTLINKKISEEKMVLAIYTIVIHRRSRLEQQQQWHNQQPFQICSLFQDCDLRIYPTLPCGWQTLNKICTQEQIIANHCLEQNLDHPSKTCETGAEPGRWIVPCQQCQHSNTCLWSKLQWLPFECRYEIPVSSTKLGQCLLNKNILMIGDSTNRGIMHYILERFNRTLLDADKTHDHKTYHLVDYDTTISFSYYPKFWIPPSDRESFAQVFAHAIKQTFLTGNHNLINMNKYDNIIIIGGVQWISRQHLHVAKNQLKLLGLEDKIRLVVKTMGSGFHQSVIGVHYLPESDQIKLALQNQLLIEEALKMNIEVVDTFNKTIALFKDFYPGKCSCHFHRITKEKTIISNGSATTRTASIRYHVEGQLNQLYSEILLSRICNHLE